MWDRSKSTLILLFLLFLFTYSSPGVEAIELFQPKLTEVSFRDETINILQIEDQGKPILINNDIDFGNQASLNNWEGNGSIQTPYIIENQVILTTSPSTNAIEISYTNVHFIIRNSTLTAKDGSGIRLLRVSNATIIKNTLLANNEYGITLLDTMVPSRSSYNILINNTAIDNVRDGIAVRGDNNTLINNIVKGIGGFYSGISIGGVNNTLIGNSAENVGTGFNFFKSHKNTLINNTAYNLNADGFDLYESLNNTLINNTVTNGNTGFDLFGSHNSILIGNTVQNSAHGFIISSTLNSRFQNNTAIASIFFGFSLFDSSDFNDFRYNLAQNNNISNNEMFGIKIDLTSGFNEILHNYFLSNNNEDIQAYCDNSTNLFDMNYWDDQRSLDLNDDGYSDEPYLIDGVGNCKDNKSIYVFHLSVPAKSSGLSATAGISQITLNWSAPLYDGGSPITEYRIYRSLTSSQGFSLLWKTIETTFIDTQVDFDQRYYYKISAVNEAGEGDSTNEVNAIPIAPPTSVEPTTTSAETITSSIGTTMTTHSTTESPTETNSSLNSSFNFVSVIIGLSIIQTIFHYRKHK